MNSDTNKNFKKKDLILGLGLFLLYFEIKGKSYMKYKIRGYCYKKWFFYIGWIIVTCEEQPVFYYDNNPTCILRSDPGVVYLTCGLTQKSVMNRMSKTCNKKLLKKYPVSRE